MRIAIVGAGFSGTALAATLHRFARQPLEIILLDKSGEFGAGFAYRTPFSYHLLNVRSKDMSAFEDMPQHFVDWLKTNRVIHDLLDLSQPIEEQFVPRLVYGQYLKNLLRSIEQDASHIILKLISAEVVDVISGAQTATLMLKSGEQIQADKVVLALGNGSPSQFPFPVAADMQSINNPWHYTALNNIPNHDPVMIVGTGLSMIDAVLTLHHQKHQGPIYALSRHGLLPLPHSDHDGVYAMELEHLSTPVRSLIKHLRQMAKLHTGSGGNWRSVINELRRHLPALWQQASLRDKKIFFRHILPYWNIHRHRVHPQLDQLLTDLSKSGQLKVIGGRIVSVEKDHVNVRLRHTDVTTKLDIKWLINCMGPSLHLTSSHAPLVSCLSDRNEASFDALNLGFVTNAQGAIETPAGTTSSLLYSLGPPTKGTTWECMAVPGIRKQISMLAEALLA